MPQSIILMPKEKEGKEGEVWRGKGCRRGGGGGASGLVGVGLSLSCRLF